MSSERLKYYIALALVSGVGATLAKSLISYCGSAEAVFRSKKGKLLKVPGIGLKISEAISNSNVMGQVEGELKFLEQYKIKAYTYLDEAYPKRLKNCVDGPIVIYHRGNADLNNARVISFVGTRNATEYGRVVCERIVEGLAPFNILLVSGLAYGIDVCAHRAALKSGIPTVGVLGHGLDRIYPYQHNRTAEAMVDNGGLITEFPSNTTPDRENFPKRNRIIAGMSDATLIVETGEKGGAIITAHIANSYNRDVLAVPGRVNDKFSVGCNHLIRSNVAALVETAEDVVYALRWDQSPSMKQTEKEKFGKQTSLMLNLNESEKRIVNILQKEEHCGIDKIILESKMNTGKVASILLDLEFNGVVRALPGKVYQLI